MASPASLRLDVEDDPSEAEVGVLLGNLEQFNESQWPRHQPWRPLGVFVRDRENIVAGLAGETYCGWLFIRYLWVSDSLRGQGVGRQLMDEAERRASERGCHSVWLDTFSFQAPEFIENWATWRSANSTGRPTTSGSCFASDWREARATIRQPSWPVADRALRVSDRRRSR